jgi:hypothetical protein
MHHGLMVVTAVGGLMWLRKMGIATLVVLLGNRRLWREVGRRNGLGMLGRKINVVVLLGNHGCCNNVVGDIGCFSGSSVEFFVRERERERERRSGGEWLGKVQRSCLLRCKAMKSIHTLNN